MQGKGWGRNARYAYLYCLLSLSFNVATINAGAHVLHDDGSGTAVYEDAVLVRLKAVKRARMYQNWYSAVLWRRLGERAHSSRNLSMEAEG